MVAPKKTTDDRDVISQLADKGEETLRHLVDRPRRMMDGAIHGFEERLHDIATRLRACVVTSPRLRIVSGVNRPHGSIDIVNRPPPAG